MSELIKGIPWDSEFFGLRIGRVDIRVSEDWSRLEKSLTCNVPFDLVYVFSEHSGVSPLYKASLVDTKVVYAKAIKDTPMSISPFVHFYEESKPDDDLYSLALISGMYSRYKKDKRFPLGSYERLYRRWIENSVNGQIADVVLYYAENSHKRGMITLRQRSEIASIGLIAVDSDIQGKGIGTILIQMAERWLVKNGIKYLEVATQNENIPGCRFYEKCGFERISETDIFHLWV